MQRLFVVLSMAFCLGCRHRVSTMPAEPLLARRYSDGEISRYRVTSSHESPQGITTYVATAEAMVERDSLKRPIEAIAWTSVAVNGTSVPLTAQNSQSLQWVSLDPAVTLTIPSVERAHPALIGPMLDFMTFYVDLQLAEKQSGLLSSAGAHEYVPVNFPASWADGQRILLGQDAVDFDITIERVDQSTSEATVLIRHVPPTAPSIKIPAPWMRDSSGRSTKNWVQVTRDGDRFIAAIGHETFDVTLRVSLVDGRIRSASMYNPVDVVERDCSDRALTQCGPNRTYRIVRNTEMQLESVRSRRGTP